MKKNIIGRLAAALFVASLLGLLIVSCGQGGAQTAEPASATLSSARKPVTKATLKCIDKSCGTVTFYDSTHGPGPKGYYLEAVTSSDIAAGTHLILEVSIATDSVSH